MRDRKNSREPTFVYEPLLEHTFNPQSLPMSPREDTLKISSKGFRAESTISSIHNAAKKMQSQKQPLADTFKTL